MNLSCKRRKVDEDGLSTCQSKLRSSLNLFIPQVKGTTISSHCLPKTTMEQALLQYQAQVLASNDYFRALAHQRLQESFLGRNFYSATPIGPTLNTWLPSSRFHSFQNSIYSMVPTYCQKNALENMKKEETKAPMGDHRVLKPTSALSSLSSQSSLSPTLTNSSSGMVELQNMASSLVKSHSPLQAQTQLQAFTALQSSNNISNKNSCEINSTSVSSTNHQTASSDFKLNDSNRKRKRPKRSDEKPTSSEKESYTCTICGASYPHKFELNRHIKVSHVRPHRCNECGKGFGHRNYLKVHIETVHLGQKSHQCRLCGKFLSTGGNLNVHVRTIHFGEKKYNCPVCSRSFGQQCNMKTHMKRHYTKSEEV